MRTQWISTSKAWGKHPVGAVIIFDLWDSGQQSSLCLGYSSPEITNSLILILLGWCWGMGGMMLKKKLTLTHAAWIFYSWEPHDLLPQNRTQGNSSHSMNNRNSCFIYLKPQRWNLQNSHTWFLELITTPIAHPPPKKLAMGMLVDWANMLYAFVQDELSSLQQCPPWSQMLLWVVRNCITWEREARKDVAVNNGELWRGWDTQCLDGSFWKGKEREV